jgi:cytochrome b
VRAVRVWDLPTRLFHWALTALVVFSFVTAKLGGAWVQWHFYSGYTILVLLVFRLLWGFAGGRYARFANFVVGPRAIVQFWRGSVHPPGHNPLGALSVVLLLAALLLQASVGLFATDDIASEGPLAKLVSSNASQLLSRVHRWNEKVLLGLLGLHVAAVLWYRSVRRIDLIGPMIMGDQRHADAVPARDDAALRWRAVVLLALSAGLVAWIVNL